MGRAIFHTAVIGLTWLTAATKQDWALPVLAPMLVLSLVLSALEVREMFRAVA